MIETSQLELDFAGLYFDPTCFGLTRHLLREVQRYFLSWLEGGKALIRTARTTESIAQVAVPAARLDNSLVNFLDELHLRLCPSLGKCVLGFLASALAVGASLRLGDAGLHLRLFVDDVVLQQFILVDLDWLAGLLLVEPYMKLFGWCVVGCLGQLLTNDKTVLAARVNVKPEIVDKLLQPVFALG